MFATLWSRPIATNAEMGKKIAQNFPAASLALTDIQTVRVRPTNDRWEVEVRARCKVKTASCSGIRNQKPAAGLQQ